MGGAVNGTGLGRVAGCMEQQFQAQQENKPWLKHNRNQPTANQEGQRRSQMMMDLVIGHVLQKGQWERTGES